jgi:hypothetical protein
VAYAAILPVVLTGCTRAGCVSAGIHSLTDVGDEIYTHGVWRVKTGRESEFIATWLELGEAFLSLPASPGRGTLLQSLSDSTLFYSFGPWRSIEDVETMRRNPDVQILVGRLRELCTEASPGTYRVAAVSE